MEVAYGLECFREGWDLTEVDSVKDACFDILLDMGLICFIFRINDVLLKPHNIKTELKDSIHQLLLFI